MKAIFSVDVEDWFHILDVPAAPGIAEWDSLPSHVERLFRRVLDVLGDADVRATCFFLGWVGERYRHLVKEAERCGHEIASHGYSHSLVHQMTPEGFYRDVDRARAILEDICGQPVRGYRAPGFSATREVLPWFYEKLVRAGYTYDSSIFPSACEYGGVRRGACGPHTVTTDSGRITEFPMTVTSVLRCRVCLFGGGYLRLAPLGMIEFGMRKVLREGRPVICYVHPREMDADHPRLPMSLRRRWKSYVNLATTEGKVRSLLSTFEFVSFRDFLAQMNGSTSEAACAAASV